MAYAIESPNTERARTEDTKVTKDTEGTEGTENTEENSWRAYL